MSRRQPLIFQADPSLISSGLQPDRHLLQKALWAEAENAQFYGGKIRRLVPPVALFNAGAEPIRGISQQQDKNGIRWIWAASGGDVSRWYGPAPQVVVEDLVWQETQSLLQNASFVDFTHYGDWTIINSGMGKAKINKPEATEVGTVEDYAGPSDTLRFMKKRNQIMAIGTDTNGKTVSWSDADQIESWEATAENLAGSLPIEELDTRIRSACNLGDYIACYAEDQMALVRYVGLPYVFGAQVVLDGIGACGKAATCSDGRMNYGVGRNGVWRTDGQGYNYIDEGLLRDYLQDNVNWAQASKIVAFRNDITGCIDFFFPMLGSNSNNEGWSFDPRYNGWSPVPAYEMAVSRQLFNQPLAGTTAGNMLRLGEDREEQAPLVLSTKPMTFEGPGGVIRTSALVDEIELMAKDVKAVQFRYGVAERLQADDYQYSGWQDVAEGMLTYNLESMPSGIYHKLEFRSTGDDWRLDLQGFALYGEPDGTKRGDL